MTAAQVLLDARGATPEELSASARTLFATVPVVELVHADDEQWAVLGIRFGQRVTRAVSLRRLDPVLVVPGGTVFALGAVRRVLADLATPGRQLSCVLVPGERVGPRVACWSAAWVSGYAGTPEELVDASLAFDRAHLPAGSPSARAWLRADSVGVSVVREAGDRPRWWVWRTGAELAGRHAVARVRSPLGVARRRAARRQQRRGQAAGPHAGRYSHSAVLRRDSR